MPLDKEAGSAKERTYATVRNTLLAHFSVLQLGLPHSSWAVLRPSVQKSKVLAGQSPWEGGDTALTMRPWMTGNWLSLPMLDSIQFRALDASEAASLALAGLENHSYLIRCPLQGREGYVNYWLFGFVSARQLHSLSQAGPILDTFQNTLQALSGTLGLFLELKSVRQQLHQLQHNALVDPLTGALNRAGWMNRVEHLEEIVARSNEDVAIIMLDLDLLKLVNDVHGHAAGDALLKRVVESIRSCVRSGDVIGRLGGDEFGVAAKGLNIASANYLKMRISEEFKAKRIGVSLGLALKSEAGSMNAAMELADTRMYKEKRMKPFSQLRRPVPGDLLNQVQGLI